MRSVKSVAHDASPTYRRVMRQSPSPTDYDAWVRLLGTSNQRPAAKRHLQVSGRAALDALRRGLQHPKPIVRQMCVGILDRVVDQEAYGDLVAVLDDEDIGVRKRALHALARERCKEDDCRLDEDLFVSRALQLLRDKNPELRVSALALTATRQSEVKDALVGVSRRDPHPGVRNAARLSLRRVGLTP